MLFPTQLLKTSPYEWNTVDVIMLDELSVWKVMVVCVRICVCVHTPKITFEAETSFCCIWESRWTGCVCVCVCACVMVSADISLRTSCRLWIALILHSESLRVAKTEDKREKNARRGTERRVGMDIKKLGITGVDNKEQHRGRMRWSRRWSRKAWKRLRDAAARSGHRVQDTERWEGERWLRFVLDRDTDRWNRFVEKT